jgi:tRNA(Ile)-lysidine synthase
MPTAVHLPSRGDPIVRRIVASWRRLTGGGRGRDAERGTLVACSGGADSSALLLALATVRPPPPAAHIVHDLRPPAEALRDRDTTAALCVHLGVPFHEEHATVTASPGNDERNARLARYRALHDLAVRTGRPFVATGHHADDQLETILMRLLRGAGPRGLGGIAARRSLGETVTLVRPMLMVTREESRALCARCGWVWAEDRTNADTTRVRAALRATVIPALLEIAPDAPRRAGSLAGVQRAAHAAIASWARRLEREARIESGDASSTHFDRSALRGAPPAVLGEFLVLTHHSERGGDRRDRIGSRALGACIRGIRSSSGEAKVFDLGGMRVVLAGERVIFSGSRAG